MQKKKNHEKLSYWQINIEIILMSINMINHFTIQGMRIVRRPNACLALSLTLIIMYRLEKINITEHVLIAFVVALKLTTSRTLNGLEALEKIMP